MDRLDSEISMNLSNVFPDMFALIIESVELADALTIRCSSTVDIEPDKVSKDFWTFKEI